MRKKRIRFLIISGITLTLAITAAIFAVNLAELSTWRYDMTAQRLFTLSGKSEIVLQSLETPVRIAAIYPRGREEMMVQSLLREYEKASEMISVEFIDAERDPSKLATYKLDIAAMPNNALIVQSGERTRLIYADQLFETTADGNMFSGEREITGAIRYVTTDNLSVVYFVEGHGETLPGERMTKAVAALQFEAYQVSTVNLVQHGGVPGDADVLAFIDPAQDLTQEELDYVRAYQRSGGNLLILLGAAMGVNAADMPNLAALCADLGVDIPQNYLIEADSDHYLSNNPLYVIPDMAPHPITQQIGEQGKLVILPIARGLGKHGGTEAELTLLLASSHNSWARLDSGIAGFDRADTDISGPVPLAYAAVLSNVQWGESAARAVIIGNASFAYDGNVEVQGNLDLWVNSVNFLQGGRSAELIAPKEINAARVVIRGSEFMLLAVICLGVLPLIAFGIAFATWLLRRNR